MKRYIPLVLGIAAYAGLVTALRLYDFAPLRPASAQVPVGVTTTPFDLRVLGGPNLCAGGRNVVAFVDQAVASGIADILIPPGCTYVPDNNTTPADVVIEGGNWETSILQSSAPFAGPAGLDVSVGPRGIVKNIAVQGQFCLRNAAAALCPLVEYVNATDSNALLQTYPGTGLVVNTGSVTFGGTQTAGAPANQTITATTGGVSNGLVYSVATLPTCNNVTNGQRAIVSDAGFPVVFNGPVGISPGGTSDPMASLGGGNIRAPVVCINKQWVFG